VVVEVQVVVVLQLLTVVVAVEQVVIEKLKVQLLLIRQVH
jgi:hypothetical protein